MNKIIVFENPEFGRVRTVNIDGEPWLVGKDVAEALGYGDGNSKSKALTNAVADHVDEEDKRHVSYEELKGYQNGDLKKFSHYGTIFINESGLYSLILSSKLPTAKKFKHWVTSEVLPSVRKHGGYIAGQEDMADEELLARAVMLAQSKIEEKNRLISEQQERIQQMRPKEIFANAVAASKATILVGELAKVLKQNGINVGQNRLFEWMRENGYLIRRQGTDYNMPTQRSMEMGLFEIKETAVTHSDGHTTVSKTPKVTGRGQEYFINKFLA